MKRRRFLQTTALGAAAMTLMPQDFLLGAPAKMPKRKLGRTGEKLSILGFGGILVMDEEQSTADMMVARAFENGINYFDVAPSYGNAEERLGPALEPYRKRVFLACKTGRRRDEEARQELEQSLRNMRTDWFDLYQLHHLTTEEDIEIAFGPKGAMEVLVKARQEGKVRFLGFSAHSETAALAAMERFDFDTILFPINFVNWFEGNFGPRVIEAAKRKKMGILALKALAFRARAEGEELPYRKVWYHPIPREDDETARLALNWTLSQGVTAAIPPGDPSLWDRAFRFALAAEKPTAADVDRLRKLAAGVTPVFRA